MIAPAPILMPGIVLVFTPIFYVVVRNLAEGRRGKKPEVAA